MKAAARVETVWKAAIVALALAVAAIPLLLLDAGANDGAAPMLALLGIPAFASAALIQVAVPRGERRPFVVGLLPWYGALTVGMLFLGIPAVLAEPQYYEAETQGGMLATLAGFAFFVLVGLLLGVVVWFLLVLPVGALLDAVRRSWRGEPVPRASVAVPLTVLGIQLVILLLVIAFGDTDLDELPVVQIVATLLGLHDPSEVASELGLWVVRGVIVAVAATATILTVLWHTPSGERVDEVGA